MLALTMVLSLSGIALAVAPAPIDETDTSSVTINKNVELINPDTVNPAETFNFTIGAGVVTEGSAGSAPTFNPATFTIDFAQGAGAGTANINLPDFNQVGIYTYPITETAANTAGMGYDAGTYYLAVTVLNSPNGDGFIRVLTIANENGIKNDAFNNTFSAGSLNITKETTGNFGDTNDEFEVTVTLTPPEGKNIKSGPIDATDADSFTDNGDGTFTATYTVKHGSSFTMENIPYGVGYTVEEADNGKGYTVSYEGAEGTIQGASQTAAITNTRNTEVATGISLDNLPYVLLLAVALGGLFLFGMRKRFGLVK